jgi:3-oxoacyl-[acyl-carrier-protein] synthase-3
MARFLSVGSYAPESFLKNEDFEGFMDTSDEWITERSGIKKRRISPPEITTSDIAYFASLKALKKAGLKPDELDMVIVATSSPDSLTPSTACILSAKLGIRNKPCFDISAACPGFIYAVEIARGLLETGDYKYILVVGVESGSKFIDWEDRSTAVLFGDAGGAAVLTRDNGKREILATYISGDGTLADLLKIEVGTAYPIGSWGVRMKGREVFRNAVVQMGEASLKVLEKAGVRAEDITWLVPHQANLRIIEATRERLNLPKERVYVNIDEYGNTSAASIPVALDEMEEKGLLKDGDLVLAVSFGAGFTWGGMLLRW